MVHAQRQTLGRRNDPESSAACDAQKSVCHGTPAAPGVHLEIVGPLRCDRSIFVTLHEVIFVFQIGDFL